MKDHITEHSLFTPTTQSAVTLLSNPDQNQNENSDSDNGIIGTTGSDISSSSNTKTPFVLISAPLCKSVEEPPKQVIFIHFHSCYCIFILHTSNFLFVQYDHIFTTAVCMCYRKLILNMVKQVRR